MMRKETRRKWRSGMPAAMLAVAIGGAAIGVGCDRDKNSPAPAPAPQPTKPPITEPADATKAPTADEKQFVAKAASSGMLEVQSSKLALDKSEDAQTKQFAQKMIDDHTAASNKLKSLADSQNIPVPDALLPEHQTMLDKVKDAAGADFTSEYQKMQVKAHDATIADFEQSMDRVTDPQLKGLIRDTLPVLKEHQKMAMALGGAAAPASKPGE